MFNHGKWCRLGLLEFSDSLLGFILAAWLSSGKGYIVKEAYE